MARLGAWYHHCFETRPWATLIATNGTLTLLADALAQSYEREKTALAREREKILPTPTEPVPWDWHRSGRFLLFGSAMAPLIGEWNHFLEHRFPMRSPTGKIIAMGLVRRVAMDQLLLYVARSPQRTVRSGHVCRLDGHHGGTPHARLAPGQVPRRTLHSWLTDQVYGPALLANWSIWPLLQLFNFGVLPLRFRVPFSASCGIAWTLYLSILNQKDV